jgi:hypothetical protein
MREELGVRLRGRRNQRTRAVGNDRDVESLDMAARQGRDVLGGREHRVAGPQQPRVLREPRGIRLVRARLESIAANEEDVMQRHDEPRAERFTRLARPAPRGRFQAVQVHDAGALRAQPVPPCAAIAVHACGIQRVIVFGLLHHLGAFADMPDDMRPRARPRDVAQVAIHAAAQERSHVHDGAGTHTAIIG